jgi:hypothetical protein
VTWVDRVLARLKAIDQSLTAIGLFLLIIAICQVVSCARGH